MRSATFAERYDALLHEPRLRALYGESGYFNVGYWVDGEHDIVAACDRLVDTIAAAIPPDAAVILDVGCGLGTGTRRVADRFPRALVAGVNLSIWQLTQARRRRVMAAVNAEATALAIGNSTADAVVAIESAEHFDTREDFFAEAYRVLRPGGTIALSDMLFHEGDAISEQMLLPRRRVSTIDEYQAAMRRAGFNDVRVRDITANSWTPYCVAMRRVFGGHEDLVQQIESSLAHYILAVARRA